ncbi:MAG: HAD-IIB family hydrolase [Chromatiaceae bacterium]|nr:MAG: HAD-IIB family hydrolase [Chromatiaceae bacterium]
MKVLATDLDRTLLPNGRWPADAGAIDLFNELTVKHGVTVVYVTGRNLDLARAAISEYGVRPPDILIGDVGTSIRRYDQGDWTFDDGWVTHVQEASPRWDAQAIKAAVDDIPGLVEQGQEHLNQFKQSYFVDHASQAEILQLVETRAKGRFDEVIVYSYDSQSGDGLLDLLPASATKQTALEFVAEALGVEKQSVVFCGDSGNDVFPLTAGFAGVLVRNADEQLVAQVRRAMASQPGLRVYHAQGGFMGLSGYYTSGVMEGAHHYGLW